MPYLVHLKSQPAIDENAALITNDAASAHQHCDHLNDNPALPADARYGVTFVASDDERYAWQRREQDRFYDGTYARCPWYHDGYDRDDHYAHISKRQPGLVSFTPDDAAGVNDKRKVLKPASYLRKYFPDTFDDETIARYAQRCTIDAGALSFARTPDEIVRVYAAQSIGSCMDSSHTFSSSKMPVHVYGDSDLALAYVGDPSYCSARAIVWPDKLIYSRTYGDHNKIQSLLEAAGYTRGSIQGARIRRVIERSCYVLPYIDYVDHASDDGTWIVLDGKGPIATQGTSGLVPIPDEDSDDDRVMCSHCGEDECYDDDLCRGCYNHTAICSDCNERENTDNMSSDDNETYCSSCMQDRFVCDDCSQIAACDDGHNGDDGYYCDDCWDNASQQCEIDGCGETFNTHSFSYRQTRDRERRGVHELCSDCADHHHYCGDCYRWIDQNDDSAYDDGCIVCALHTWALLWRAADVRGIAVATTATSEMIALWLQMVPASLDRVVQQ
jgi:hypothetical protein